MTDSGTLLGHLVEKEHFVVLEPAIWQHLQDWYGGGPSIVREVSMEGLVEKRPRVLLNPITLELLLSSQPDNPRHIFVEQSVWSCWPWMQHGSFSALLALWSRSLLFLHPQHCYPEAC
jgi:DUSP domain